MKFSLECLTYLEKLSTFYTKQLLKEKQEFRENILFKKLKTYGRYLKSRPIYTSFPSHNLN